ncbi:hypothetical protein [Marinobacter salicampi]|uniref:hypothetical protein n=1 Tax=Marinobacter salicampi TaxID=435907 RepID=UPI00140D49C0|nr:hypothetical protein [Marinobacter salicampi]
MNESATISNGIRGCLRVLLVLVLASATSVAAQSRDDLDVTMRMVIDDEDLSDRVVQELQLPESALLPPDEPGPGAGAASREQATEAREQGRALGREMSEESRNKRDEIPRGRPGEAIGIPRGKPDIGRGGGRPDDLPRPGRDGQGGGRPDDVGNPGRGNQDVGGRPDDLPNQGRGNQGGGGRPDDLPRPGGGNGRP